MTKAATPHRRLVLVRHGETEGESSIRYHGRTDVPLSDLGRAQLRAARDTLRERHRISKFAPVFSSPLIRATEGARIIAGEISEIIMIEDFVEVHFGLFEGLTADEIRERHPEDFARWNADRLAPTYTYPGGESRADFAARVDRGTEKMLALWEASNPVAGDTALLVAHRGVIRQIVRRLTGASPNVELGSIQILIDDGSWRPAALDLVDHHARV
jgi:broad specificity phosphatase PhoE